MKKTSLTNQLIMNTSFTSSLKKQNKMKHIIRPFLLLALLLLGTTGAWAQNNTIDLSGNFATDEITVYDGYTLTGTLDVANYPVKISIADGATVTLQNVTINGENSISNKWAGITCSGDATLILVGTNTVKGFYALNPGIYVPENKTLTIQGGGSLNASSNGNAAGIGGGYIIKCGNIVIAGGTVTATGGNNGAAGIGSGYSASCGTISITGGTVTATGGYGAAGIGSGNNFSSCGTISITGGTVTATGGRNAAGIGSGFTNSSCGFITITDGVTQVTAIKGEDAPNSIGANYQGTCGTITIGGVVYWDGSNYQNGGDNPQTGLVKSPYYYPIPNYTLGEIPSNWTVTADGTAVTVTPYANPNQDKGYAIIPVDAEVVLTPPDNEKPLVKSVTLIDPLTIPLTFEAKEDGVEVTFTKASTLPDLSIEYSLNGGTWTTYTTSITLTNIGDKVSFRGNNASYAKNRNVYSTFSCSADCYIYGNVMSLIDKDNFATNTTLDVNASYSFCKLFINNTHIFSHDTKPLLLPATTLNAMCYFYMFYGCSNLTQAPALPATTLANGCYMWMFDGCHLTEAPELHATTLTESCYYGMFSGCTVLTIAHELPATTLANDCYHSMFSGCTSLTTAPVLPATTLANYCYAYMFQGCTSLITAPELPATTLANYCYANMFHNCTSLTTAPELPATTLANDCYAYMFQGCTSLTTAPELPAPTLESNCYYRMFLGCTHLNKVTCLATSGINSNNSTTNWLYNVAETGTFIKPASVTWPTNDVSGIPPGWTTIPYETFLPLTFEAKEANAEVRLDIGDQVNLSDPVEYSKNGGTWTQYTSGTDITLDNIGDKVSFRGNNATYANGLDGAHQSIFYCDKDCYVYGNVMSLVDKENFSANTTLTGDYTFAGMFSGNANLYNHSSKSIILPATTLTESCYQEMFAGCGNLTTAPALPAETLAKSCYQNMFTSCGLTTAPALPATNLADACYMLMFSDCKGLTTAPALPATELKKECYSTMFNDCTSLATAPT